jgi:hypothetical protein
MSDDFVANSEILYRRIAADRKLYTIKNDGIIKILSLAFSDRELKVSVDRAKLCNNNPRHTLGKEAGVVISLVAEHVRSIDDLTRNDSKGKSIQQFKIDVEPAPLPNNLAHAEICAIPEFTEADKGGAFHRLCQRLSRLATVGQWVDLPKS